MTWTKVSDDFADDCWTLSDAAFRLHIEGLCWSNRKLLDLRIPKEDVKRLKRPEAVAELVAVGWWSDEGDAYVIRHHAAYQRCREDVVRQQEANRENGRRGGRPPRVPREQALSSETQSLTQSLTQPLSQPGAGAGDDQVGQPAQPRSGNPVTNPVAKPVVNRKGRDGTGQALRRNGSQNQEQQQGESWPSVAVPGQPRPLSGWAAEGYEL